jgi:hypothetical protein
MWIRIPFQIQQLITLMWISTVLWIWICIQIRKDPNRYGNLYSHPEPHPNQINIQMWIRIRICIK